MERQWPDGHNTNRRTDVLLGRVGQRCRLDRQTVTVFNGHVSWLGWCNRTQSGMLLATMCRFLCFKQLPHHVPQCNCLLRRVKVEYGLSQTPVQNTFRIPSQAEVLTKNNNTLRVRTHQTSVFCVKGFAAAQSKRVRSSLCLFLTFMLLLAPKLFLFRWKLRPHDLT